jgi:uncharacterized protein
VSEREVHEFVFNNETYGLDVQTLQILKNGFPVDAFEVAPQSPPKKFCGYKMMLTDQCNMACHYCFERNSKKSKTPMSYETAVKAIDFLVNNSSETEYFIDFFGGEPLLEFELMKKIVDYWHSSEYSSSRRMTFRMITNGTLLNADVSRFCKDSSVEIVVSLDGGKAVHDKNRVFVSGHPTYDVILRNIVTANEISRDTYQVLCTIPKNNSDFLESAQHLLSLPLKRVTFQPEHACESDFESNLNEEAIYRADQMERLLITLLRENRIKDILRISNFKKTISALVRKHRFYYACFAWKSLLTISPEGELFPCPHYAGLRRDSLGNFMDDSIDLGRTSDYWKLTVDANQTCSSCWARYLCGGLCMLDPKFNHQACAFYKKTIELGLFLYMNINHAVAQKNIDKTTLKQYDKRH